MPPSVEVKKAKILARIGSLNRLAVAFSGGVDSTLLLALARQVLGDQVVALTARSQVHPSAETRAATKIAGQLGVRQILFESREMGQAAFLANGPDRCYICKMGLFRDLKAQAARLGIDQVAHGANSDDLNDFRPGMDAARQMGILAPLLDAGMTKAQVRTLARQMGLSNWDRPAMACLATRIPYGAPITPASLSMVEKAEAVLGKNGFHHCRVRHHGNVARIEVPQESLERFVCLPQRQDLVESIKKIGFQHVALDLEGYCSGSMNRGLDVGDGKVGDR